jgi:hypothetical protein
LSSIAFAIRIASSRLFFGNVHGVPFATDVEAAGAFDAERFFFADPVFFATGLAFFAGAAFGFCSATAASAGLASVESKSSAM